MPFLQNQPFVRIVIPLILGIVLYSFLHPAKEFIIAIFLVLFVVFCLFKALVWSDYVNSIVSYLIFFSLGLLVSALNNNPALNQKNNLDTTYVAKLTEIPTFNGYGWKANLDIIARYNNQVWLEHDGKILAYFDDDTLVQSLHAGSSIAFNSELIAIEAPKNPFEFNFKKYLYFKNIHYRISLKSDDWVVLNNNTTGIKEKALNIREKIIRLYVKNGISDDQLAVFSALTLGYKNKLDARLKSAYSGAGAMHVLAVSGMHVGIIFLVLDWFFKVVTFFSKRSRFKYVIIILLLWCYALLSGLSTSVLRASIMFSFILLGHVINKRPQVYNSLAASATLLLLYNPNYLYEVGFQLSYAAVVGIVFLYPKIYRLFFVPTKVLNVLWQLTAVSIAAQIATFPISVYYFNQFPVYFWLSNIVVSLSATVLLLLAFILVLTTPFCNFSKLVGNGIDIGISYINRFVFEVNELPYAVISDIDFSYVQVILVYLIIACTVAWLIRFNYNSLLMVLILVFGLVMSHVISYLNHSDRSDICVYHLPGSSAVQLIDNQKSYWIINEESVKDSAFVHKAEMYWKVNADSAQSEIEPYYYKNGFLAFKNYKALIINKHTRPMQLNTNDSICLDFVLVSGKPSLKLIDLPSKLKFNKLIIDGSVPPWIAVDWKKQENVCIHDTKKSGMFLVSENQ